MHGLMLDLKTALRQLRRAPAASAAAVLTLAVGIGAATAVFSFVAAVLSAGSPVDDMDRVVAVWSHNRREADTKGLVSPADFLDWRERARTFESIAAWSAVSFNLSGAGTPVRAAGAAVTEGYLDIFRWRPVRGRAFMADDFQPGAPRVLIASDVFWRTRLGARPEVIGQVLRLDGEPATLIGVLPPVPGMAGIFVPASLSDRAGDRTSRSLFVFARLGPGVSFDAARDEMTRIGSALEAEHPETNRGWAVNTRPAQEEFVGPQARLVFALLAVAVLAVLLIGCVNIANLLLARGATRRGEMALRLALGAGGWRLTRQLLIECAAVALLGAVASVVVSRWTLDILLATMPIDSPWVAGGVNARVLALTAAGALLATLAAGLAPALSARRTDLLSGLHATGRSALGGNRRLPRLLVGFESALAVLLLVIGGLAARTLIALERQEPGFDMTNVITAAVTLPPTVPPDAAARWFGEALSRAREIPGVEEASATSRLPFAGGRWNPNRGLEIDGRVAVTADGTWAVDYVVTPGFVEAFRVRLLEGRAFVDSDGADAPHVVMVNEAMARRYWGERSPLGARLRQSDDPPDTWRTVVGIIADIRNDDADQPPLPYLYMPLAQRPQRTMTLALRVERDPASYGDLLRRKVAEFAPDQALYDVRTMEDVWEADLAGSRVLIRVFGALAAIALGLAGLGVWSVAAQMVGQRTREIGVRVALGANARQIARLIAWQGLAPVVAGLVAGLGAALAAGQLMRSILFQVSPSDPLTLLGTLLALAIVGLVATLGPALRAARLDPIAALRTE